MIVQFSHLVLLFLAVQAIAANQGGAHHASFPADPSRLNPSPPHQQHLYSYQQGNQQPESVHSQQAPPQQAPQQAPQQLPPHLSMGRNMHQQSTSTPPGFGNQQQSNFYRPPGSFYSPHVHQQPQSLGIFARIKNSLTSASSAIQNALDFPGNEDSSSQYAASVGPMGTPGGYPQSDRRYVPGSVPPSSSFGANVPPGIGHRASYPGYTAPPRDVSQRSYHPQQQQPPENANVGFMGKVRNIFSGEQSSAQQQRTEPFRSYAPPSTGQPFSQKANMQYETSQFHQPQPPSMQQHASQFASPTGQIEDQQQAQQQFQHYPVDSPLPPQQSLYQQAPVNTPEVDPRDWLETIPSDPQVLIHEDSVVFIMKPKSFHKKKFDMSRVGPSALQVFTDFERVFTRFKTSEGGRALTTEEVLEASGLVSSEGISEMQRAVDDMERRLQDIAANAAATADDLEADGMMDHDGLDMSRNAQNDDSAIYAAYEDGANSYHQALATRGNVHMAQVFPTLRPRLAQLGLRDSLKDSMQMLLTKSVPLYIFSSGFGDIVTFALAAAGVAATTTDASQPHMTTSANGLPNNVRIISNFFRTAPDGTIRAFSQPTVHDRNKNVTTAARFMGMPVPQRPYALVLAAHEDDVVRMTDGLTGLQDTLTIGYMEVTEDLPQRLPVYLNTFDVVIVGDGSFKFVSSVLEDILQTPIPSKAASSQSSGGLAGKLPNLSFGLRRGLGMLLNTAENTNTQQPQQHQQASFYQPSQVPPVAQFQPTSPMYSPQNTQASQPQYAGMYPPSGSPPQHSHQQQQQQQPPHPHHPAHPQSSQDFNYRMQ